MRHRLCFAFTLLLLLAVACRPGAAPPPADSTQPPKPTVQLSERPVEPPKPAAPAATPTAIAAAVPRGGTFVLGLNANPDTINSSLSMGTANFAGCKILEGLVSTSADQKQVRPELAARWDISPDGRTYTFQLRQGVLWHDGKPFTSEDVKWSFENVNKLHSQARTWILKLESIQTPDPQTVVLKLKEAFAPLLASLRCGSGGGAISPKHVVEPGAEVRSHRTLNMAPIGTGPFVFKEWISGDRIVVVRNDKYWKKDLPYLDQVVVKIIPDTTAMSLALRAGEVNYVHRTIANKADVVRLQNDPKIQFLRGNDIPSFQFIQFNQRRPPLDKLEVRKALFMALDREFALKNVFQGLGRLQDNMIDSRLAVAAAPDISLLKMYPYDVARANKMLDDAGVPRKADGTRFQVKLVYEVALAEWREMSEVVRLNWDRVGVKVIPEPLERPVMLDKAFQKRDFDTMLMSYTTLGDPTGMSRTYVCEDEKNPVNFGNPTGYCRKEIDALFAEGERTVDFEKRREVYRKAQKILAEDLPIAIFLGREDVAMADRQFELSAAEDSPDQHTSWEYVHKLR